MCWFFPVQIEKYQYTRANVAAHETVQDDKITAHSRLSRPAKNVFEQHPHVHVKAPRLFSDSHFNEGYFQKYQCPP